MRLRLQAQCDPLFFCYFVQMLMNALREDMIVSSLVTTLMVATAVHVARGTN